MSGRYIVSANYRDRESAYRWLIRRDDQPSSQARACMSVSMRDVKFIDAPIEETGFGCNVVASCGYAVGQAFEDETYQGNVRFTGSGFIDVQTKEYVDELVSLELNANGTMDGVFVKESVQERDQDTVLGSPYDSELTLKEALNGTLVIV